MAKIKRTVVVASAMVALTACAPAGYEDGTNAGAAEPVAVAAAEPTVTVDPESSATPGASASPARRPRSTLPCPTASN